MKRVKESVLYKCRIACNYFEPMSMGTLLMLDLVELKLTENLKKSLKGFYNYNLSTYWSTFCQGPPLIISTPLLFKKSVA